MSMSHRVQRIRSHSQARSLLTVIPIPESAVVPVRLPSTVYEPFQRKYNVDARSPLWKRLFFRYVFLPFNRFCFFRLGLITPDHLLCGHCGKVTNERKGTLGWMERQGIFSDQWRAEQEAAKYPFGGVEPLAFNTGEEDCTCRPRSLFPNSAARARYQKHSYATVGVEVTALQRLANVLAQSEHHEAT